MASPNCESPHFQRIQQRSSYTDVYKNAPITPLRTRMSTQRPGGQRWEGPDGWGARHLCDAAPFTLWDAKGRKFRFPSGEEMSWIEGRFGTGRISSNGWLLCIETNCPPKPVALTLGNMPVIFVRCGEMFDQPLPKSGYSNPRVPDPCPTVRWPNMTHPIKNQIVAVLTAIAPLANVRSAIFLPFWTIFELETDGRSYERLSLPGVVAGRTALYHHEDKPFLDQGKSITHPYQGSAAGTAVQENSNHFRTSFLTPECQFECGFGSRGTPNEFIEPETPTGHQPRSGSWSEVGGMRSGLFSMMSIGIQAVRPVRRPSHPEIEFVNWHIRMVNFLPELVNNDISDGVCGAPIIDVDTGRVCGFFHLSNGITRSLL
ncbi:hypothetical protein N7452_002647 [Penicillium brevicompactum]|uniref:Uncharacterized protein n=1 Tax=Penicillium brevicompactum TaxID=5074 RepID=A0A9W9QV65_PENBR|nr:hypothetical protein N7452_002647 [Penicillium brevicompactum]